VTALATKLQTELPALFTPGSDPDWSIYTDDVLFEDPLNRFRGASKYRANIGFLKDSFAFRDSAIFLHDTVAEEAAVVTRWTLAMTAAFLPWAPRVVFTGESIYGVDVAPGGGGGVNRHVDTWDSITAQGFPSVEAVGDLVGQLSPAGAAVARGGSGGDAPPGVPPYLTLRRAAAWEVRRVDAHDVVAAAAAWADRGGGVDAAPVAAVRAAWAAAAAADAARVPLLLEAGGGGRGDGDGGGLTACLVLPPGGAAAAAARRAAGGEGGGAPTPPVRAVPARPGPGATGRGGAAPAAVRAARDELLGHLRAAGVAAPSPDTVTVLDVPGPLGLPFLRHTEVWVDVTA